MTDDTRDRVIRLEAEVDGMEKTLEDVRSKVNEMHDVLMQARGARWMVLGAAGLIGFAASFIGKFFAMIGRGP